MLEGCSHEYKDTRIGMYSGMRPFTHRRGMVAGSATSALGEVSRLWIAIRRSTMHARDYFSSNRPRCECRHMRRDGRANKDSLVCLFNKQSNFFAIGARYLFGDRCRNRCLDPRFVDRICGI